MRTFPIVAIDPGPRRSALVVYDKGVVDLLGLNDNAWIIDRLQVVARELGNAQSTWADVILARPLLVVEFPQSYGMAVGREVFETAYWCGRFVEVWRSWGLPRELPHELIYRPTVKAHLCNTVRATDANVRQVLIDRFGGNRQAAVGTKKAPGPLYGIKEDLWQALAVAVTVADRAGHPRAPNPPRG